MKSNPLIKQATPLDKSDENLLPPVHDKGRQETHSLANEALRRFLLELVGLVYEVEMEQLLSPTRGQKQTALARQIAMYLAHTTGGLSLSCVGRLFARDRTTVAHACAQVEDARDEQHFDRTLSHLESAIAWQMELFRLTSAQAAPSVGANGEQY